MVTEKIKETDLYLPVKALLEGQGYEVKGEVGAADVVGVRGTEEPVIVELKTGFSLSLFHQAIDRQAVTTEVYVAVPKRKGKPFQKSMRNNKKLSRRLGIGLMTVHLDNGEVKVHVTPGPFNPRQSKRKRDQLLEEFRSRVGDPNTGGVNGQIVTAYRQDALRCLKMVSDNGQTKASIVATETGVERARNIMADNHYSWFAKVEKGVYDLSSQGASALIEFVEEVAAITVD